MDHAMNPPRRRPRPYPAPVTAAATLVVLICLLATTSRATSDATTASTLVAPVHNTFVLRQAIPGHVIAFGDLDGDKFTDIVVADATMKQLQVHAWRPKIKAFQPVPSSQINLPAPAAGVVTIDLDGDGLLDLLVTLRTDTNQPDDARYSLALHRGLGNLTYLAADANPLASMALSEPTLLDYNGDMTADLLGVPHTESTSAMLWLTAPGPTLRPYPAPEGMCMPAPKHANAFVDVNGDCKPDLFLTCADHSYQVWIGSDDGTWTLARHGPLPPNAGLVAFADMDANGSLDAVFPVCTADHCDLYVAWNRQMPPCSAKTPAGTVCRPMSDLCSADPDFVLDFANPMIVPIPLAKSGSRMGRIRLGDYNLDGYPDVLFVADGKLYLLGNTPCVGAATACASPRTFVPVAHAVDAGPGVTDAYWFDYGENGSFDIIVASEVDGRPVATIYENTFQNDAFFIKTLATGTSCTQDCQAHALNAIGSSFKFTVVDTTGAKKAMQSTQTYQTSSWAMQLPYAFSGLGRTNNYIEELAVGVSRRVAGNESATDRATFTGIIPNSQLVIYPRAAGANEQPWRMELFLNPTAYALNVLAVLLATIVVLGVVTAGLQWLEKREDERDKIFWI
ncbi:hypothetical protein GGF32_004292 [Allomyces javanicus]|nr:hypothetical protein GGF32_004292 [Allomyces javanicus]